MDPQLEWMYCWNVTEKWLYYNSPCKGCVRTFKMEFWKDIHKRVSNVGLLELKAIHYARQCGEKGVRNLWFEGQDRE